MIPEEGGEAGPASWGQDWGGSVSAFSMTSFSSKQLVVADGTTTNSFKPIKLCDIGRSRADHSGTTLKSMSEHLDLNQDSSSLGESNP